MEIFSKIKFLHYEEITKQADYHFDIKQMIFKLKKKFKPEETDSSKDSTTLFKADALIEPYKLKLPTFSGNQSDILDFVISSAL